MWTYSVLYELNVFARTGNKSWHKIWSTVQQLCQRNHRRICASEETCADRIFCFTSKYTIFCKLLLSHIQESSVYYSVNNMYFVACRFGLLMCQLVSRGRRLSLWSSYHVSAFSMAAMISITVFHSSHCCSMDFNAPPFFFTAVGVQSPSEGYRAGDMALLGFVMAALLVLCLIVIGYLISRLKKRNPDTLKLSEVSIFSSSLCEFSSEWSYSRGIKVANKINAALYYVFRCTVVVIGKKWHWSDTQFSV